MKAAVLWCLVIHLRLIAAELVVLVRRDSGVPGNAPLPLFINRRCCESLEGRRDGYDFPLLLQYLFLLTSFICSLICCLSSGVILAFIASLLLRRVSSVAGGIFLPVLKAMP